MKDVALDSKAPPSHQRDSGPIERRTMLEAALSALLEHAGKMQLKNGMPAVARGVLDVLVALFPHHAFGVCLVEADGADPVVDVRLPPTVEDPGRDPTRLFPELADERIFPLEGLHGSTLHLGTVHGSIEDGSTDVSATAHAAALLAAGARAALALRAARPMSAEVSHLRAQLVQAEKLATLGQIVAGLVHELANPVTSIVACTEYLSKKASIGNRPEELAQLQQIGTAADRILKFTRDLVSYARPASEKAGPVALPEIVQQAYAFSQHELSRRSVTFACDYEDGAPAILGQAGPLTQVFINLFTNAAHAMESRGGILSVRTRVDRSDGRLYVDVTDSGIGIAAELLPKIFDPFFTTKEKGQGTGLGLSIVKEILDAHGCSIDAASTFGEGTTFTIGLPLYTVNE